MSDTTFTIDTDEDGFWLVADEGHGSPLRFRIDDPEQLYDEVKRVIGSWLYERDMTKATRNLAPPTMGDHEDAERLASAYDLDDPKHPTYHDRMSGVHDNREKT